MLGEFHKLSIMLITNQYERIEIMMGGEDQNQDEDEEEDEDEYDIVVTLISTRST